MESYIIWGIAVTVLLAIFIPYLISFRRQQKLNQERKREAQALGIDRPTSQFPFINQSLCIGCGSCVLACPEGDVLGVVHGKATVINGLRCVGHGLCEPACPVNAIRVGLGDVKTREDIPVMDAHNETNIPGLFIAGELGGLSLLRNAITQGTTVVERIAEIGRKSNVPGVLDVVIVGAGPAGLTAALAATQKALQFRIFDQQDIGGTILQYPRQKLVMTQPVEIPLYGKLSRSEYSKEALLEIWKKVITQNNIHVETNVRVSSVTKTGGMFQINTTEGNVQAHSVILAMGRRGTPRKLGVPGEDLPKVAFQLIDAQSYTHKNLLVVGGGDSAVETAVGLGRQTGNKVSISYRKEKFFRIKKKNEDRIQEMIRQKKVIPYFNSQLKEIRERTVILDTQGKTEEIPNDFVFIFAGGIPPFPGTKRYGYPLRWRNQDCRPGSQSITYKFATSRSITPGIFFKTIHYLTRKVRTNASKSPRQKSMVFRGPVALKNQGPADVGTMAASMA